MLVYIRETELHFCKAAEGSASIPPHLMRKFEVMIERERRREANRQIRTTEGEDDEERDRNEKRRRPLTFVVSRIGGQSDEGDSAKGESRRTSLHTNSGIASFFLCSLCSL